MKTKALAKEQKIKKLPDKIWDMRLYVINRTPKSVAAVTNLRRICHKDLEDKCRITVIDIERYPQRAKENQIVAIPTLVKTYPLPMRRFIGDLSNSERVLAGLDLQSMVKNDVKKNLPAKRKAKVHM